MSCSAIGPTLPSSGPITTSPCAGAWSSLVATMRPVSQSNLTNTTWRWSRRTPSGWWNCASGWQACRGSGENGVASFFDAGKNSAGAKTGGKNRVASCFDACRNMKRHHFPFLINPQPHSPIVPYRSDAMKTTGVERMFDLALLISGIQSQRSESFVPSARQDSSGR
jgi:hypothetical protein